MIIIINIMEDIPVSFSWISPKSISENKFITYCFAYIRDPKTYNILYAGVKYDGNFADLKFYKPGLRKTAVERLLRRPIFANFNLGDDENYKKNLTDVNFKFNGIGMDGSIRKTTSIGKFFLYCALNQEYSNLGIFTNKLGADVKFEFSDKKYEIVNKNKGDNTVYLKYGYEFKNNEMKRIIPASGLLDIVYNLRGRCKFYGKNGDRRSFEEYYELENEFLTQFGIYQNVKKNIKRKFRNYLMDKRVIFFRHKMSNNTYAHIALMEYHDWEKFVCEVYNRDIEFNIPGLLFNTYCMGFTIEKTYRTRDDKLLYRKIAIDRMIDRPNIIDCDFFESMQTKDLRTWFSKRLGYFSEQGIGRINYKDNEVNLASCYIKLPKYNELIKVYDLDDNVDVKSVGLYLRMLFYPIRYFFGLFNI